jgi:hypothetical protein
VLTTWRQTDRATDVGYQGCCYEEQQPNRKKDKHRREEMDIGRKWGERGGEIGRGKQSGREDEKEKERERDLLLVWK